MDCVKHFECYSYNKHWYLVEMLLDLSSAEIDWDAIVVPDEELDEDEWQCPYMEQYLTEDGTAKLCETYDEPDPAVKPCRVAFFIYKDGAKTLRTPYGEFALTPAGKLPRQRKKLIEFEDVD